jgi:hypothetical protein
MRAIREIMVGRIVDQNNERHQRITRTNRSRNRLHFAAAVTDSPILSLDELRSYFEGDRIEVPSVWNDWMMRTDDLDAMPSEIVLQRMQYMMRDGVIPPWKQENRILGFTVQLTEEDIDCERLCLPSRGWYAPGDAVAITLNERIHAVAPCDVYPGDPVIVEPYSGLCAATGITVEGATWESVSMAGDLGVLQINTRAVMR